MRNDIDTHQRGSADRPAGTVGSERSASEARRAQSSVRVHCEHCGTLAVSAQANAEVRCACGSLLARKVPGGYELKCRRCKRAVIVNDPKPAA